MAPQWACHPRAQGHATWRNPSCFVAPSSRSHLATTDSRRPRRQSARGSDAPCRQKSSPNTLFVSAPAAASLPLACRCCAGGRGPSQKKRLGGDNVQFWRSPSEKVGISGNDEIPEVFDTDPTKPITSWKT